MATRKSEWLASIKPILDRDEAKRDAKELAKELGDLLEINIDASPENLKQLTDEFNKQLSQMGKQPIVFSEKTLQGIVGQFANAVAEGFAKGANVGLEETFKLQLANLKKQKEALLKEQDDINRRLSNRSRIEKINNFSIENAHGLPIDEDVVKQAEKMLDEMYEYADRISELQEEQGKESEEYISTVLDAQEAYNKFLRMQKSLKKAKPALPKDLKAAYDLFEGDDEDRYRAAGGKTTAFDYDKYGGEIILDAFEEVSDVLISTDDQLNDIQKRLKEIDLQIESIVAQAKAAGAVDDTILGDSKDGLKTLKEIEAAYDRIAKKNKKTGGKALDGVATAVDYIPGSESLTTLRNRYNTSLSSNEDWETQYQWLVKFVKEYENYSAQIEAETDSIKRKNMRARQKQYTALYEELKPMAENAETMLRGIIDVSGGKQPTGVKDANKQDADIGPTSEDVANAERIAALERQAREEADAKARAEAEAAEAAKQKRIEEEKAAKAAEKKRLADEAASEAQRKAAEEAERERLAKEESVAADKTRTYTGYRAIEPPESSGKTKHDAIADWGGEYFSTDKNVAASYGENFFKEGDIVIGEITPKNPLVINANGLRWDEFDKMPGVKELFPGILELMKDPRYIGDDGQKYINEQAKLAGYDSVILENVQDALDGDIKEYGLSTTIAVLDDKIVSLVGSMAQLEAGTNRFADVISSEIPSYYVREDNGKKSQLGSPVNNNVVSSGADLDDDSESIEKENGALEDKLELLRDIAEQYGYNITQKQRDRYEELNQKDMNEGLTAKEDERYWELGEQIDEADSALEEFEQTYDRIIVKLANGKNVEILPDDKGLRTLAKIDEEYGESYNGVEIEDVIYERIQKEAVAAEQAVDSLNDSIEETKNIKQGSGSGIGTGNASSAELEAAVTKTETLQDEVEQKNKELADKDAEIARVRAENEAKLKTEADEKDRLQEDLNATNQQLADIKHENELYDTALAKANEESNVKDGIIRELREQLAGVKTGVSEEQVSVSSEELKNVLSSIVYNVKIVYDDADKQANKIAIDESALEQTLKRVFTNVLNPHTEQNDSEPKNESWALEKTLLSVKEVLGNIQTNTAKPDSIEVAPAKTDIGSVLATENTLAAIKTAVESINTKVVKGAKVGAGSANDSASKRTSKSGSQDISERVKTQRVQLAKLTTQLATSDRLTDNVAIQISKLLSELNEVEKGPDLSKWIQRFTQLKATINIDDMINKVVDDAEKDAYKELLNYQKTRNQLELQYTKAADGSQLKAFYKEQLDVMDDLISTQFILNENEEYAKKLAEDRAKQEIKLGAERAKQADREAKAAKKDMQKQAMLGKAGNAVGRAQGVYIEAEGLDPKKLSKSFTQEGGVLDSYYAAFEELRQKQVELSKLDVISDEQKKDLRDQINNVNRMTSEIGELVSQYQRLSGDNVQELGVNTLASDAGLKEYEAELKRLAATNAHGELQIKGFDNETKTLTYTVKNAKREVTTYTATLRGLDNQFVSVAGSTKRSESFLEATKRKMAEISSYMSGMAVLSRATQELRRGIQYVREIDLALTELKKVTDETEESYDKFLKAAAKTGTRLGTTISAVTDATATFAKLGYSMEQATEMAEAAIVYKNVGDNIESTGDAADSIISTMKGFRLEATESMAIVDKFNEVGNKFAITSQGVGEALRLSASALSEGGNSLDESIGLITAANEVVNDPSSVGTALKTLTLRLRGSKTELEEMGEDVTDMATTTSALQAKLLALTGGQVDIMTDANTFKNSTQILREMAEAWEDMTDIQRASALELMGGKRQANVLSALIQNFDTVEKVIETSANSAGSALKENERYLDSIQGKIDQFNNAMQAMWSDTLDSDMVKGFVAFGTEIIKVIDKIGLLNTALLALGAYKGLGVIFGIFKEAGISIEFFAKKLGSYLFGINAVTAAETTLTQAQVAQKLTRQGLTAEQAHAIAAQTGLTTSTANLSRETLIASLQAQNYSAAEAEAIATKIFGTTVTETSTGALLQEIIQRKLANSALIQYAIQMKLATAEEVANMTITQLLGLGFKGLATAVGTATKAIITFLFTNPVGWIILAVGAIAGGIAAWNKWGDTVENLSERLEDLKSELSDLESEIDTLNSELKTTEDRMAELMAMPSLSFVEQEELAKLKQTTAELEHQLKLKEMLAGSKEDAIIAASEKYIDKAWNSKKADKAYAISNGVIKKDGFWSSGVNTKTALDQAMLQYQEKQDVADIMRNALSDWGNLSDYDKYVLTMKGKGYSDEGIKHEDVWIKAMHSNQIASKKDVEKYLKNAEDNMRDISEGINMIFADEAFDGLEYGMSNKIDTFLDEVYAYQLKWRQAQGEYVKSDAISSMFDSTSTKEMQAFGKSLQEIADSDLTDENKNAKILEMLDGIDGALGDGVNKINGKTDAYNRLHLAMKTVGVTAQDISDYFVLESGAFDSNSIQGIANQYQHMASVMDTLKNMSNNKFTFDGIEYNWDEFFSQDDQGKFKANAVEFSKILNGMDEESRETFISIVESAANSAGDLSKIDWNQAIAKLDFSGLDRTFELLNNEFEGLNNEMFAGAADDINGLIDTVSELQAALEDVAGTMDLVHTAQTQMNSSGKISTKTALELMQTTEDWESILEITNGTIKLRDGAEQHLIQTELTAIQTQLHYAWTTAQARYETALAAQGELDYANNSGVVMTAEGIKAEAIGRVSAVVVALGAAMDKLMAGEWGSVFSAFGDTYKTATATVVQDAQQYATDLATLKQNADQSKKIYDAFSSVDTLSEFKNNYDFDETPGDKYGEDEDSKTDEKMDAFQREMDYWENRIGANQARYEQLQNEIDLLEAKGQKAGKEYYDEQLKLTEERRKLLEGEDGKGGQKGAALAYLKELETAGKEGSEEWFRKKPAYWETNRRNPLNCWNFLRALYTTTQG